MIQIELFLQLALNCSLIKTNLKKNKKYIFLLGNHDPRFLF